MQGLSAASEPELPDIELGEEVLGKPRRVDPALRPLRPGDAVGHHRHRQLKVVDLAPGGAGWLVQY